MNKEAHAIVDCSLLGKYIDDAEDTPNLQFHSGEPVRPRIVADLLDVWGQSDGMRDITLDCVASMGGRG